MSAWSLSSACRTYGFRTHSSPIKPPFCWSSVSALLLTQSQSLDRRWSYPNCGAHAPLLFSKCLRFSSGVILFWRCTLISQRLLLRVNFWAILATRKAHFSLWLLFWLLRRFGRASVVICFQFVLWVLSPSSLCSRSTFLATTLQSRLQFISRQAASSDGWVFRYRTSKALDAREPRLVWLCFSAKVQPRVLWFDGSQQISSLLGFDWT